MSEPYIGIDFGTTTSTMAWFNPATGRAEVLNNDEGRQTTPSVVYFGAEETLVGEPAEGMLEDVEERRRVVSSVKRELDGAPTLALPGRRVKPVEVAAAILSKLRQDADRKHFHQEVKRAVITYPAAFNIMQQEQIAEAARQAGFEEVELLAEPIAAAVACARAVEGVGEHVLVYDLGGGTFDLALVVREDGEYQLGGQPQGLVRCGGDDFDIALYDYLDAAAADERGEGIGPEGRRDPSVLRRCRQLKESLSTAERVPFNLLQAVNGRSVSWRRVVDRESFEELIGGRVRSTVRLTKGMVAEAERAGSTIETVVLVGGSSRVPLVKQLLGAELPVQPIEWHQQDLAVALGAAYHAHSLWDTTADTPKLTPKLDRSPEYRTAVEEVWQARMVDEKASARLTALAKALELTGEQASQIERQVMGDTKEDLLAREEAKWTDAGFRRNGSDLQYEVSISATLAKDGGEAPIPFPDGRTLSLRIPPGTADGTTLRLKGMGLPASDSGEPGHLYVVARVAAPPQGAISLDELEGKPPAETPPSAAYRLVRTIRHGQPARTPGLDNRGIALSPSGDVLAIQDPSLDVRLIDLASGTSMNASAILLTKVFVPPGAPRCVAFSPDGQYLAHRLRHQFANEIWIRSARTLKTVSKLKFGEREGSGSLALAFGKQNELYSIDINRTQTQVTIRRWNLDSGTGAPFATSSHFRHAPLRVSPYGNLLVAPFDGFGLWETASGARVLTVPKERTPTDFAFCPTSAILAAAEVSVVNGLSIGTVQLMRMRDEEPALRAMNTLKVRRSIAYSPDGTLLIGGGADASITIWDPETGEPHAVLTGHTAPVVFVTFSPDGNEIISASDDGTIKIWRR